ncbi:MAG: hypothetical protein GC164_08380 [Phycisphaera sp.]|nr:hypothetical protein [Phycisphaera sp.]
MNLGIEYLLWDLPDLARRCLEKGEFWMSGRAAPWEPEEIPEASPEPPVEVEAGGVKAVAYSPSMPDGAYGAASLQESRAVCHWLLHNEEAPECNRRAMELYEKAFHLGPDDHPRSLDVLGLACYQAGADQRGLAWYTRFPKFKPPTDPRRVRSKRAMAWVLMRHRSEGFWTGDQVRQAFRGFLPGLVVDAYENGYWEDLATWMKLAYWIPGQTTPSPSQILQSMYRYVDEQWWPKEVLERKADLVHEYPMVWRT